MIRFIHAADIHLDSPMRGIDSASAQIDPDLYRKSTRIALKNLVDFAINEKVDFLTLGGDNYDGDWDNYETGLYFQGQIARLGKIPVVALKGNHDAASKMTLRLHLPGNFKMLADDKPEVYEILPGIRVIGQGFGDPAETRNLAAEYPRLDGSGIKIGLLHTSLDGRDGHANYAPCHIDDLRLKHYHFWGLGHIHKHSWEERGGESPILFPGNLQGRHIKESGPKGAWLITLDDDGNCIEKSFVELDVTRWHQIDVNISGIENSDDFFNACERKFTELNLESPERIMAVRVRASGRSELHFALLALQEMRDNALLANVQSAAINAAPGRIWVEKVELASAMPETVQRLKPAAMTFLQDFINTSVLNDDWISSYLASDEIDRLRNNVGYFTDNETVKELMKNFEPALIQEFISEIPEILEMKLARNPSDEIQETEK
ncbi:MAG: exonuclease SbcCD subunit D [Isosphaeraceae bacterium]